MSNLRFLVVDDATFIRDLVKKTLRGHFRGCEIQDAPGVAKAQSLMKTTQFDLILSDWEMPEITGEEFLRWVRSQEKYTDIPFIMVTSRGDREHVVSAVKAGVSDYLGKPFTAEDLIKRVTKALRKAGKGAPAAPSAPGAGSGGIAQDSIAVLTGGGAGASKPAAQSAAAPSGSAAALTQTASKKPAPQKAVTGKGKGVAQLRFAKFSANCAIRDISLQAVNVVLQREGDWVPQILEQVVFDIELDESEVARINAYVHSIQAGDSRQDSERLLLVIRYVDNDPQKMDLLSRYVAKHR